MNVMSQKRPLTPLTGVCVCVCVYTGVCAGGLVCVRSQERSLAPRWCVCVCVCVYVCVCMCVCVCVCVCVSVCRVCRVCVCAHMRGVGEHKIAMAQLIYCIFCIRSAAH